MAIELINLKNVDLPDGYKMDMLSMLVGETEAGRIEWKPEKLAYTRYTAQLSDAINVEVTPFDYNYSNKYVKLTQYKDGERIILTMNSSTLDDFESRIAEIEKAIFNQLYRKEFFDVLNIHDKKDLPKIKAYPNDVYLGKDNLPAIKTMPNESKSAEPVKKVKNYDKFIDQITRMTDKEAKRMFPRKKVTISFEKVTVIIEK